MSAPQLPRRPHGVGLASVRSLLARLGDMDAVTQELMATLCGAPFDPASQASMVMQPQVLRRLLFDALPLHPQARRVEILDQLNALLRLKLWNVRICREHGLLQQCCELIANGFGAQRLEAAAARERVATVVLALARTAAEAGTPTSRVAQTLAGLAYPPPLAPKVRQRLGNLLITLVAHSMSTAELKTLLSSTLTSHGGALAARAAERPAAAAAMLRAISGIAKERLGPRAYFDLPSPGSGMAIEASGFAAWPRGGLTTAMWFRLEGYTPVGAPAGIFRYRCSAAEAAKARAKLRTPSNGWGVDCVLQGQQIVVRVFGDDGGVTAAVALSHVELHTWLWLCVVLEKKPFWRSAAHIYLNGRHVADHALPCVRSPCRFRASPFAAAPQRSVDVCAVRLCALRSLTVVTLLPLLCTTLGALRVIRSSSAAAHSLWPPSSTTPSPRLPPHATNPFARRQVPASGWDVEERLGPLHAGGLRRPACAPARVCKAVLRGGGRGDVAHGALAVRDGDCARGDQHARGRGRGSRHDGVDEQHRRGAAPRERAVGLRVAGGRRRRQRAGCCADEWRERRERRRCFERRRGGGG